MLFSAILSQESVKNRLLQSAKEGRVSHALLFLGPEGSGALALATAFAQYLVCERRGENDSCGECPACRKMAKLAHPDVTFSYPVAPKEKISKPKSSDYAAQWREAFSAHPYLSYNQWMELLELENKQGLISVEESANIIRRLSLKSVEAPYRIVIMWLPEKMNNSAANKLLKILEEPEADTLFFLVANDYEQILPTIASRTQLVKVNRIPDEVLTDSLSERFQLPKDTARRLAHRADGNYHEALRLIDNNEADHDLNTWFLNWMRACFKLDATLISDQADHFASKTREEQKGILQHALSIARECLLINYGDRKLVRLYGQELEAITRFAPFVNQHSADEFIATLDKAYFHLERNANSRILFWDLSIEMNQLLGRK